jgi:hypothetical protein
MSMANMRAFEINPLQPGRHATYHCGMSYVVANGDIGIRDADFSDSPPKQRQLDTTIIDFRTNAPWPCQQHAATLPTPRYIICHFPQPEILPRSTTIQPRFTRSLYMQRPAMIQHILSYASTMPSPSPERTPTDPAGLVDAA